MNVMPAPLFDDHADIFAARDTGLIGDFLAKQILNCYNFIEIHDVCELSLIKGFQFTF